MLERYRMKKMARLVSGRDRVLDLGWAGNPNPYLTNPKVIGLDLDAGDIPGNYSACECGNFFELPAPFEPASFDALIAGEVIEHVEAPVTFLQACWQCLAPGGIIVLSTPNPNSPIERLLTLSLSRRHFYTQHHVMLYPQRWLIRVMEMAGFESVRLLSGGIPLPFIGLAPFPRPWCYQTIAIGQKGAG